MQVLNELASVSRKKLGMSWEEVTEALAAVRTFCPPPISLTTDTHDVALRIAARYGYTIHDGLIAATELEADCRILYSEDLQDGQVIERRLTVHNPFRR